MSLVPPKELEIILSDATGTAGLDDPALQTIGRLVTEGFESWSSFDQTYRKQADQIRATQPGQAHWADVGTFLVKHCGATDATDATFGSFEFKESEIIAVEEQVPTVRFAGNVYACGDTGGLRASAADGSAVRQLGLNLEPVQRELAEQFSLGRAAGPAFISKPGGLVFLGDENAFSIVLCFVRQRLQQERGSWFERGVDLHLFATGQDGEAWVLSPEQRAALVRACHTVPRVKDAGALTVRSDLPQLEATLANGLRRPPEDEMVAGIRYAVWSVAILVMIPKSSSAL